MEGGLGSQAPEQPLTLTPGSPWTPGDPDSPGSPCKEMGVKNLHSPAPPKILIFPVFLSLFSVTLHSSSDD